MKCRKCGSDNLRIRTNPKNSRHIDLYCADCGAWKKFANADEIRLYSEQEKPSDGWVKVSERKPDKEFKEYNSGHGEIEVMLPVLGWAPGWGSPLPVYYDGSTSTFWACRGAGYATFEVDFIAHWMPWPEPPNED